MEPAQRTMSPPVCFTPLVPAPAKPFVFTPIASCYTSPSEPSGNCVETVRNDGNCRKLTRTPPEREAAQDPSIRPSMHPSTECQPTNQPTKQQRGQANKPTKQPTSQATEPHNSVFPPSAVGTRNPVRGRLGCGLVCIAGEALRPPHLHSIRPSMHPSTECQPAD